MSSYTPPFVMTDEITSQVIEIAELIGELSVSPGLSPNPKLRRQNRIRSIYSSLAIEQNTLSLDQVTAIIEGRRVLGPPRDIQEVKNAFDAYEKASTLNPESQEDLLLAHRLIMTNLIPDAGCYRSGNVGVFNGGQLIHAGTPAAYVPEVMQQLFDWLRSTSLHPLISGCIFHYEFEFIHPFSDGNGRTGRLWHSLILQKWKPLFAWLPIETLIHEHQGEYYHVLNSADAQGNCSGFVSFMLRIIRDALLEVQQIDHRHVGDHVGNDVGDHVGKNEEAILLILRKQPKSTAKSMAELTHLSLRQVERILASLRDHGKIRRIGSARSGSWEILDYGNAD